MTPKYVLNIPRKIWWALPYQKKKIHLFAWFIENNRKRLYCVYGRIFCSSFFCNVIICCFNCILNIEMLLIITVLLFNFFFVCYDIIWLFHIFHFQEFLYQLQNCTNVAIGGQVTSCFEILRLNYRMFLLNCSKVHTLKSHSCATFLQRFIYSSAIKAKLNKIHTKLWFEWRWMTESCHCIWKTMTFKWAPLDWLQNSILSSLLRRGEV